MPEKNVESRRVLVVEDEADIADLVALHLGEANCDVTRARDGDTGLRLAMGQRWDLVMLDLRLPGTDGLSICRTLRRDAAYVPILMLTSKSSELDRVLGLEIGADDYVTKPFSVTELVARVRSIFRRVDAMDRRSASNDSAEVLQRGALRIDSIGREVQLAGRSVALTAREFDLLLHFAENPGRVYSRAQLLDRVWGYGHDGYEHTVNSHINRLRAKIEPDPANPELIVTVWGVGYKLEGQRPLRAV